MSIIKELSSQTGDRTEKSNQQVAAKCLQNPVLLQEIADSFDTKDKKLLGDCMESFTMVATDKPLLIVPYAAKLIPLRHHKDTRVRWEIMHSLALVAHLIPNQIQPLLSQLKGMAILDKSTIVRDYTVETIGNYGTTSSQAAQEILPIFQTVLDHWGPKHAARIFKWLQPIGKSNPNLRNRILRMTEKYKDSTKPSVKKEVTKLRKILF